MEKRYYWLRLKDDFFTDKRIKKLRRIAGGDTYTIIYLKMMLRCLNTDGVIEYEGIEDSLAEELALDLDEEPDNVEVTVQFLMNAGLLIDIGDNQYVMPTVTENTGSDNASTKRVQAYRERQKANVPKIEAKTNAERQNAYRAKKLCQDNGHVPFIEDYENKKRYGGNYYICFKRDKCRCVICGDNENLCMHHIDGYDENKPQNNDANKMITLCRKCHSNVHSGEPIPTEILESIGYYDFCNESNENCNGNETQMKRNGNAEKEIEKEKEKDINVLSDDKTSSDTSDAPLAFEGENYGKDVKRVLEAWNSSDLPRVVKVSPGTKRYRLIVARIKEYGIDQVLKAIGLANDSTFCKNSTFFDLEWFVKPNNFPKVLEGKYNKPGDSGGGGYGRAGTAGTEQADPERERQRKWSLERAKALEEATSLRAEELKRFDL